MEPNRTFRHSSLSFKRRWREGADYSIGALQRSPARGSYLTGLRAFRFLRCMHYLTSPRWGYATSWPAPHRLLLRLTPFGVPQLPPTEGPSLRSGGPFGAEVAVSDQGLSG